MTQASRPPMIHLDGKESEAFRAPVLHFDILPENALGNVVRRSIDSARATKSPKRIKLEDISVFFGVSGDFGTLLQSRFTTLRLQTPDYGCSGAEQEDDIIDCTPEILLSTKVPNEFGESIRTLIVQIPFVSREAVRERADFVSTKFPNIRSLILRVIAPSERVWLKMMGTHSNIKSLRTCGTEYTSIATYFPYLRHLHLSKLNTSGYSDQRNWKKVAENIETLSVCNLLTIENIDEIESVTKYCRKIKHLELSGMDEAAKDAISKCTSSYGGQLECAKLHAMSESQLLRVKRACPTARIAFSTGYLGMNSSLIATTLKIGGSELKEANVSFKNDSQEAGEVSLDWSTCTNIEKVQFWNNVTVAEIGSFLKSPKFHLRYIHISMAGDTESVQNMVSLLARGTGALEKIYLSCRAPPLGSFNELVNRNKSLRCVEIGLSKLEDKTKHAIDVIKTFLKSPALQKLEIRNLDDQYRM